jgi:hypothetical protein
MELVEVQIVPGRALLQLAAAEQPVVVQQQLMSISSCFHSGELKFTGHGFFQIFKSNFFLHLFIFSNSPKQS